MKLLRDPEWGHSRDWPSPSIKLPAELRDRVTKAANDHVIGRNLFVACVLNAVLAPRWDDIVFDIAGAYR